MLSDIKMFISFDRWHEQYQVQVVDIKNDWRTIRVKKEVRDNWRWKEKISFYIWSVPNQWNIYNIDH